MLNTIIFVHIPKTAGTTFLHILSNNFDPALSYTIPGLDIQNSIEAFKSMNKNKKHDLKLIKGHFTLNLHQELPHQNYTYITFLRDPIDHFISTYFFIKRNKDHNYYEQVNKMNSIDEFIDFRIKNNQDNLQTRHLSGSATDMSYNPINFAQEGEKYFSIAKDNLTNLIQYCFIMESFDESLVFLKNKLGWKNIYYESFNVTRNRPQKEKFSEETISKIEKTCIYDLQLYEFAKKKYNSIKDELDINWGKEMEDFHNKNLRFSQRKKLIRNITKIKNSFWGLIKR